MLLFEVTLLTWISSLSEILASHLLIICLIRCVFDQQLLAAKRAIKILLTYLYYKYYYTFYSI